MPQLYFRLFYSGGWGHRGMRVPLGRAYAQNMHSLDSGRLVKIAHPGIARLCANPHSQGIDKNLAH